MEHLLHGGPGGGVRCGGRGRGTVGRVVDPPGDSNVPRSVEAAGVCPATSARSSVPQPDPLNPAVEAMTARIVRRSSSVVVEVAQARARGQARGNQKSGARSASTAQTTGSGSLEVAATCGRNS